MNNIADNIYGDSKASKILATLVRERGDSRLNKKIQTTLTRMQDGFDEFVKLNNPHREEALLWWRKKCMDDAITLENAFGEANIPLTYLWNVTAWRLDQARALGAVVEKLRDRDPDHRYVVEQLRLARKEMDERAAEHPEA